MFYLETHRRKSSPVSVSHRFLSWKIFILSEVHINKSQNILHKIMFIISSNLWFSHISNITTMVNTLGDIKACCLKLLWTRASTTVLITSELSNVNRLVRTHGPSSPRISSCVCQFQNWKNWNSCRWCTIHFELVPCVNHDPYERFHWMFLA